MMIKKLLGWGLLLSVGWLLNQSAVNQQKQPNIIFIVADDLGWQDVGFMGSEWFETPHLDSLANHSLVFEQAYMYPTCSPSRAALYTGKQSFRTQVYNVPVLDRGNARNSIFSRWTVEQKHVLFSELLNQVGYKLIHIGKWHIVGPYPSVEQKYPFEKKLSQPKNGDLSWLEAHLNTETRRFYPRERGFHENIGGTWWGDPARGYENGYASNSGGYRAPFNNPFIEEKKDDQWLTDRLTDEALDFMERNSDEPFFVNLHYYAPHRPTVPRNDVLLKKFLTKEPDLLTGQGTEQLEEIAAYATMIQSIDDNVQRILEFLDERNLIENTVIIFTSDNGFNGLQSMNNRLRGAKGNVYEGGLRVPALIHWQGRVEPNSTRTPITVLDYFPTFLDIAGFNDYDEIIDGKSIVPLLNGESFEPRSLFWQLSGRYKDPPCSIIRKGDWKLIQFLLDGRLELYNLEEDLSEKYNKATTNPDKTRELLDELIAWRKKNRVPLPPDSVLGV